MPSLFQSSRFRSETSLRPNSSQRARCCQWWFSTLLKMWSWVVGSDENDPSSFDEMSVRSRLDGMRSELRVYTPALHRAAFALPQFVQSLLQLVDRDQPLSVADLRAAGHPLPGVIA